MTNSTGNGNYNGQLVRYGGVAKEGRCISSSGSGHTHTHTVCVPNLCLEASKSFLRQRFEFALDLQNCNKYQAFPKRGKLGRRIFHFWVRKHPVLCRGPPWAECSLALFEKPLGCVTTSQHLLPAYKSELQGLTCPCHAVVL